MTPSRPDCPGSEPSDGHSAPLPPEVPVIEVVGEAVTFHAEAIQEAAAAALYYFQHDLGQTTVSAVEFARMLRKALRALGLEVEVTPECAIARETDLLRLLEPKECSAGELVFFPKLRSELRRQLEQETAVLRFCGLRGCVKQLLGARRWSSRCQALNDQIVDYMRTCLNTDREARPCALVVR